MTSNALTARRDILPRPAVCASKQKIFDAGQTAWAIPHTVAIEFVTDGGSGTPPDWFVQFDDFMTRRKRQLTWQLATVQDGWLLIGWATFNPTTYTWNFAFTATDPDGIDHDLYAPAVPQIDGPLRYAVHTWQPQGPHGESIKISLIY